MTSSNTFKKLLSIGAAMLLAVGGSLVAAEPASAAVPTPQNMPGGGPGFFGVGSTIIEGETIVVQTGSWDNGPLTSATHEWFSCSSSSASLSDSNVCTAVNNGPVNASTFQGYVQLASTYVAQSSDIGRWLRIKIIATATGGSSSPVTITTSSAITAAPTATFDPNGGTAGSITSLSGATIWLPSLAHGGSGSLPTRTNCSFVGWGTSASSTTPEISNSSIILSSSRTYYAIWSGSCLTAPQQAGSSNARPLTAEQAKNALKPVPAAVQPLVPGFLALNKPMASIGGKVALSAGDFTGLVSAKIAGKSLDFILGKTGQITMTVPQGEAGKTADLVLTFNTGSIILQDAIKYVAPVVVADVPVRPVSISAGASKLSEEAADQIRHAALANLKNTDISCVAYAVADTAAAKAAAKATATKACALAKKTNSDLTVAPITVVVDKLKARTQGVGIKVYKADN